MVLNFLYALHIDEKKLAYAFTGGSYWFDIAHKILSRTRKIVCHSHHSNFENIKAVPPTSREDLTMENICQKLKATEW